MYHIFNTSKTINLPNIGQITINGYSRSNYKTGYLIQPFNIYLDSGVESPIPPNMICLSHGHLDHISSLYSLLISSNKCIVLLDEKIKIPVQNMLNSMSSLNSGKNITYANWTPITSNNFIYPLNKNQIFSIYTYNLVHRVPCRAYGIKIIQKKIKEEYLNMDHKLLKEIKKTQVITNDVEYPLVLFVSDTGIEGLVSLPFNEYKLVIMECTFFDESHYEEAVTRCHLHWNDVKNIIKNNPNVFFILGHFSLRYNDDYLKEINIKIQLENNNVMLFI